MSLPIIIQGGMGANISNWRLARSVSKTGQLGVVSGTALDLVLARRLQTGDEGGHMRRALEHFPVEGVARRIMDRYYIPGGKEPHRPFKPVPVFSVRPSRELIELTAAANFVEVFLAKEGHDGPVGINFLEKIQLPNLVSLYGAMLAGVDYVLMGAGIPREVPGILDRLAAHERASMTLSVEGALPGESFTAEFDPSEFFAPACGTPLKRPNFIAIIASAVLALTLARKSTGRVDGFVIEGPSAGGHNALPRGQLQLTERGEPLYGPKDDVDLDRIKALGLPFWLAGSYATSARLEEALAAGAAGVQVGTAFAFCRESGLAEDIKRRLIDKALAGTVEVFTDPKASPTGFPFKVARLEGTASEEEVYRARKRICDLGYLRHLYRRDDGTVGYRCPSEPVELYVRKGGSPEETEGRKCLCNGLMANIALAQVRKDGYVEKPLVTAGEDLRNIGRYMKGGEKSYSAADVLEVLLAGQGA